MITRAIDVLQGSAAACQHDAHLGGRHFLAACRRVARHSGFGAKTPFEKLLVSRGWVLPFSQLIKSESLWTKTRQK